MQDCVCVFVFFHLQPVNEYSLLGISIFPMAFSQQLDNPVLSGSFYIYILLLMGMHY